MKLSKINRLLLVLSGFFITNALVAELIGAKIFSLEDTLGIQRLNINLFGTPFSFHLTAGVLLWPVVFIMTDIINDYFGPKKVRFLSYVTAGLIAYSFIMISLSLGLAPSEYMNFGGAFTNHEVGNEAYRVVFGQGLWIIIGSLIAFLIGQLLDAFVFQRIKRVTGQRMIWLRATGSTLLSQIIDSFIVIFIAFYLGPFLSGQLDKQWTLHQVLVTGTGNYIFKFIVAILITPLLYVIHGIIDRYLGADKAKLVAR